MKWTLFLYAPALFADISGVVKDPSGAIVRNARVKLEPDGTETRSGTSGEFRLPAPPSARVLISVEAAGFQRFVTETSGEAALQVRLAVHALPQRITVTANATARDLDESARATSILERGEWDGRAEIAVAEALRETPGVRVQQLGGPGALTSIRLRGLRAQDTAVLIDGMRFRDASSPQSDASAFTADLTALSVSRLEVMRGNGSALYGSNAMGGVVNIVSDQGGGPFRGEIGGEGGGLGLARGQARLSGGAGERFAFSGGLSHINVLEGVDGDDRYRNHSGQIFARYRVAKEAVLSARVHANNSFVGLNGSPALTAAAPSTGAVRGSVGPSGTVQTNPNDPDSHKRSWMTSALVALDQQLTPRLAYRAAYQLVDTRRSTPNGPGGTGFQPRLWETSQFNGRVDTLQGRVHLVARNHTFAAGGEWEREAFDNGGISRTPTGDSTYRAQTTQRYAGLFAEEQLRLLNSRLTVNVSGRFQNFSLRRPELSGSVPGYLAGQVPAPPNAWTGDAAASYRLSANSKIRGHIGNSFRAPSLYERYGTGFFGGVFTPYGDPRLSPERSVGGDFGFDQYFGARRARVSATYFYTQLRSVIGFDFSGIVNRVTDPFGRSSGYFNTSGGLARGVELEGETALWRGMTLRAAYTHTRTLERRPVAAGTLLTPRIFPNTFSVVATQSLKRVTLTSNFLGAGEYTGVIFGRAILWDGPRRWDAAATFQLTNGERLRPELFARVENLLNQNYIEDGFRNPRRWATAGLRLHWR